jgi:glycosyltransferase involved in cell wall biosynthesis
MGVHYCVKCLPKAVEGIINQKFQDFEFISIDDGSTDGSAEIL